MIEDDLYTNLATVTGMSSLYAIRAGKSVTVPYAVYNRISTQRDQTLTGFDGNAETAFQVDIYHSTPEAMSTIKAALITRLKTYNQLTIGSTLIQSVEILNEFEDVEELNDTLKYKGIVEFSIYYEE